MQKVIIAPSTVGLQVLKRDVLPHVTGILSVFSDNTATRAAENIYSLYPGSKSELNMNALSSRGRDLLPLLDSSQDVVHTVVCLMPPTACKDIDVTLAEHYALTLDTKKHGVPLITIADLSTNKISYTEIVNSKKKLF